MQALGPAQDEEQKLADLNIVDDEMEVDGETGGNEDGGEQEEREQRLPPSRDTEVVRSEKKEGEQEEKALTQADIAGGSAGPRHDESVEMDEDLEGVDLAQEIKADEEEDVEIADGREITTLSPTADGEEIWRHYSSATSDLSYALCEQLRLILEPTLATRLQGDFRTGKRLNMRKIIPYIASEYTKDKIWLRRTKPSRREYQVLLSLDDSRSMAESHSVDLAYQTLALVSQALNKLEVGQVSIARFGETVDVLHPFGDAGFTDADGAKVMSSFKFDQHKTDVAALVERTLVTLAEARQRQAASSSAPDLWQLQIIISDGVCQDHARLRTLLRRALEERVMIVFLIVDSLHQSTSSNPAPATTTTTTAAAAASARPSILSMQTVAYKQVNGEMQLEMERYLDTFPFEFYVVLRDVEALPGVLSDTLRQWLARVSQSEE
jgi:midasin